MTARVCVLGPSGRMGRAVIAGAAWLLKRAQRVHAATNPLLKTVAALALGPKERVVLVEVDDTWLVLGVAPGRDVVPGELSRAVIAESRRFENATDDAYWRDWETPFPGGRKKFFRGFVMGVVCTAVAAAGTLSAKAPHGASRPPP